jgi:hypothetical protein
MSKQPGWRDKVMRGVRVGMAAFQVTQIPGPTAHSQQPAVQTTGRSSFLRILEVVKQNPTLETRVEQIGRQKKTREEDDQTRIVTDASGRRQTTSQPLSPQEKRKKRAAETSSGAVPATAQRAKPGPERKRSEPSR